MFRIFRLLFLSKPGAVFRLFLVFTLALTGFLSVRELTQNVERGVAEEVRPFLGGDVSISTNEPSSGSLLPLVSSRLSGIAYESVEKSDFNTTLFDRDGNTGLVRVIAYSWATYPLYGSIVADPGPAAPGWALVTPSVQKFMSGSAIVLDGRPIPVSGYIKQSTETTFTLANDVSLIVLPRRYLSGSQLLGSEARVTTSLLLKLPDDSATNSLYAQLRSDPALSKYRIQSYLTNAARTTRSIDELSRYILLVLVVAAIFAGIVLLSANEALLSSLSHTFGIFELLGLTRRSKFFLIVALYALLSAAAIGCAVLLSYAVIRATAASLEQAKDFAFLADPILFLLAIAGCLLVGTLPSGLFRFLGKNPLESVRHSDRFDTKAGPIIAVAFGIAGIFAVSYLIFETLQKALLISAVIFVSAGMLTGFFRWVFRVLFGLFSAMRKKRFFAYDGMRTLVRPLMPSALIALLTTFAFSMAFVFLVVSMTFQQRLKITSNQEASVYAANILESDRSAIEKAFPNDRLIGMLLARITKINGQPYVAQSPESGGRGGGYAREISVTTNGLDTAPIVRGVADLGPGDVSVDEDFAAQIGVGIGDRIEFSLAGKTFELAVKNLRRSQPEDFRPSFRFQVNESAFAQAPKTYILVSNTGDVESFKGKVLSTTGPHVTFVDVHAILDMVKSVADKILSVIELFLGFVGIFAILAILTLFQSFEPLARMKAWLYEMFWATVSQVRASLLVSSAAILLLWIVLAFLVGSAIFAYLLRYLTFLVFSWPAFLGATAWFLLAWAVLIAGILRSVSSYAVSTEGDAE